MACMLSDNDNGNALFILAEIKRHQKSPFQHSVNQISSPPRERERERKTEMRAIFSPQSIGTRQHNWCTCLNYGSNSLIFKTVPIVCLRWPAEIVCSQPTDHKFTHCSLQCFYSGYRAVLTGHIEYVTMFGKVSGKASCKHVVNIVTCSAK